MTATQTDTCVYYAMAFKNTLTSASDQIALTDNGTSAMIKNEKEKAPWFNLVSGRPDGASVGGEENLNEAQSG